ncbi:GntR family transcriptional regulator [Amycolatopsis sp. NPDC051372]|uniref:GntR family transcriptional regulator n=1 Tax=unclassified Amycolatopsis TaxID=2618356 RepID=UPI003447E46C
MTELTHRTEENEAEASLGLAPRPDSLAMSVYNTIRQAIVDGKLPATSRVTEAGLAKQLGVSKTPVREALLRLKEVGLVESDGPRADRIVTPSAVRLRDAYEVREALEMKSARLAAERGHRDVLLAARHEAERTVVAADQRDFAAYRAADEAFHTTIARATGNARLARLIDDANAMIIALRQRDLPGIDASPVCASQHMAISKALLDGDVELSSKLMEEHVRSVGDNVVAYLTDHGAPQHA